jgi:hypothetical protein
MEPEEDFEGEQPYRENPRNAFNSRLRRQGEQVFNESFGTEIDFEEVREEFKNIEALEEIASMEVKKPRFPIFTFYIALVLDILDFADFTGVGWFVMVAIEIVFSAILLILMFRKTDTMFKMGSRALFRGSRISGSRKRGKSLAQKGLNNFARKYLRKYMTRRMVAILIVNVIPVVGILASNAFFVFLAHNKQTKIAKNYIALITAVGKVLDRYERQRREE